MTWWQGAPTIALVAAVMFLPGLVVLLAGRVRGQLLVAAAPAVGCGVLAGGAVVGGLLGLRWSPWVALGWTVLAALVAAALAWWAVRRGWRPPAPDPWQLVATRAAGVLAAAVISATALMRGIGTADRVTQTWDGVFHLNAVRWIVDTGEASTLTLGQVSSPGSSARFYPAGWHDVVATAAGIGTPSLPLVANASALVMAALMWPLAASFLLRTVIGPSWIAGLVTPVLAVGWVSFPVSLLSFGVLWPTALANVAVPVALGLLVMVLRSSADAPGGRGSRPFAVVVLLLVVGGMSLAHPSAAFAVAFLGLPLVLGSALAWSARGWLAGRRLRVSLTVVAVLAVVGTAGLVLVKSPVLALVRGYQWQPIMTKSQALGEALVDATMSPTVFADTDPKWLLAALTLTGVVVALRSAGTRWLVVAWVIGVLLFSAAAGPDSWARRTLTGFWYTDPVRVAALVPLIAAPLAGLGALWWLLQLLGLPAKWQAARGAAPDVADAAAARDVTDLTTPATGHRGRRVLAPLVVVLALAAAVAASSALAWQTRADRIAFDYHPDTPDRELVSPGEQELLTGLGDTLGPDAVLLGNPFNGSALAYALGDVEVVFPHLDGSWGADEVLVGLRFEGAQTDPAVCRALRATGATHLYVGDDVYDPATMVQRQYRDLTRAQDDVPELRRVAAVDGAAVYAIPSCSPR